MTRGCAAVVVAVAVAAGLALRLSHLDVRPMHHDEANQALKFGALLERGEYRYDARDHHGPTLYYLSLPAAAMRGQATLASLDERTLRGVAVAFGIATILLLPLLSAGLGPTAVATSAVLMALSPAMTFYSRMYIQEALFACFTLGFVIAIGRVAMGGGLAWSTLAGLAAGLALATKETSVVVLPAALGACLVAWWSLPVDQRAVRRAARRSNLAIATAVATATAAIVAALFFSSFLAAPAAVIAPVRGLTTYLDRGIAPVNHAHPWHYYLGLLAYSSSGGLRWSEGSVLALAAVGIGAAMRRADQAQRAFWTRHIAGYVAVTALVFSALRYKTPWNVLPFHTGTIVLAGIGFSTLAGATSSRALRGVLLAALAVASAHLGWQAWRASITYAADPRNPYVYAQTLPDAVRLTTRIRALAAAHPDGVRMPVAVIAGPYEQWPLPWYLRTMAHVGYWTTPDDALALDAPVVVTSADNTAMVDAALGERYVTEFYGLRPDVLLVLHVERDLWGRFLRQAARDASTPASAW